MKSSRLVIGTSCSMVVFTLCLTSTSAHAQQAGEKASAVPGPMFNQGIVNYDTPDFMLSLVRSSQTVAALKPKGADGFDFTPGDLLAERSQNGYFHLGDLTLRLRTADSVNDKLFDGHRGRLCERCPASYSEESPRWGVHGHHEAGPDAGKRFL